MGGLSVANFKINENGKGIYFGKISLENNGGFSLLRYRFDKIDVTKYSKIFFEVNGDCKNYQFRIKDSLDNPYSYFKSFKTSDDWELIEINLADMSPVFRGRKLEKSNFLTGYIEEIAILIGNKKKQNFQLEINKIYLQ